MLIGRVGPQHLRAPLPGWNGTVAADAPVDALQGVSESDAQHLKDAFNIKTVRDLGTNKYFLWAQAITKLTD